MKKEVLQIIFDTICFLALVAVAILILKNADFIEWVLWGI